MRFATLRQLALPQSSKAELTFSELIKLDKPDKGGEGEREKQ